MGRGGCTSGQEELFLDYEGFTKKFEPKKTTDDCYTPPEIYDAVLAWVRAEYGLTDDVEVVRPFYPGGDYKAHEYPEGCVVIDNPPFSMLSDIVGFYNGSGVRYFLFAPALTCAMLDACKVCVGVNVIYDNGARVNTSFLTNMDGCEARTAPALYKAVYDANRLAKRKGAGELPRYEYPEEVLMTNDLCKLSRRGVDYRVGAASCIRVRKLDSQRRYGKALYGGGWILSKSATARRAVAEEEAMGNVSLGRACGEAPAIEWALSPQERLARESLE